MLASYLNRAARDLKCLATVGVGALVLAAGGGATASRGSSAPHAATTPARPISVHRAPLPPPPPPYPQLLAAASGIATASRAPAARWHGQVSVWVTRSRSGVALLSFDQRLITLVLHSGTVDAGTAGWRFGPLIGGSELERLVAAFNGGFMLNTGAGGFESYGRIAVPSREGLGSIVTYAPVPIVPTLPGVPGQFLKPYSRDFFTIVGR